MLSNLDVERVLESICPTLAADPKISFGPSPSAHNRTLSTTTTTATITHDDPLSFLPRSHPQPQFTYIASPQPKRPSQHHQLRRSTSSSTLSLDQNHLPHHHHFHQNQQPIRSQTTIRFSHEVETPSAETDWRRRSVVARSISSSPQKPSEQQRHVASTAASTAAAPQQQQPFDSIPVNHHRNTFPDQRNPSDAPKARALPSPVSLPSSRLTRTQIIQLEKRREKESQQRKRSQHYIAPHDGGAARRRSPSQNQQELNNAGHDLDMNNNNSKNNNNNNTSTSNTRDGDNEEYEDDLDNNNEGNNRTEPRKRVVVVEPLQPGQRRSTSTSTHSLQNEATATQLNPSFQNKLPSHDGFVERVDPHHRHHEQQQHRPDDAGGSSALPRCDEDRDRGENALHLEKNSTRHQQHHHHHHQQQQRDGDDEDDANRSPDTSVLLVQQLHQPLPAPPSTSGRFHHHVDNSSNKHFPPVPQHETSSFVLTDNSEIVRQHIEKQRNKARRALLVDDNGQRRESEQEGGKIQNTEASSRPQQHEQQQRTESRNAFSSSSSSSPSSASTTLPTSSSLSARQRVETLLQRSVSAARDETSSIQQQRYNEKNRLDLILEQQLRKSPLVSHDAMINEILKDLNRYDDRSYNSNYRRESKRRKRQGRQQHTHVKIAVEEAERESKDDHDHDGGDDDDDDDDDDDSFKPQVALTVCSCADDLRTCAFMPLPVVVSAVTCGADETKKTASSKHHHRRREPHHHEHHHEQQQQQQKSSSLQLLLQFLGHLSQQQSGRLSMLPTPNLELFCHGSSFICLKRRTTSTSATSPTSASRRGTTSEEHKNDVTSICGGGYDDDDEEEEPKFLIWYLASAANVFEKWSGSTTSKTSSGTLPSVFDVCLFWKAPHNAASTRVALETDEFWEFACRFVRANQCEVIIHDELVVVDNDDDNDDDDDDDHGGGRMQRKTKPSFTSGGFIQNTLMPRIRERLVQAKKAKVEMPRGTSSSSPSSSSSSSILLGCGVAISRVQISSSSSCSASSPTTKALHQLRCTLSPFASRYLLWQKSDVGVSSFFNGKEQHKGREARESFSQSLPMNVVLARDSPDRIASLCKAVCRGASNCGVVVASSTLPPTSANSCFSSERDAERLVIAVEPIAVQSRASAMMKALAIAGENMWKGVVVEFPSGCNGSNDAWMDAVCRWPYEYPSLVIVVDNSDNVEGDRDDDEGRSSPFSDILDAFENFSCTSQQQQRRQQQQLDDELVDRLLSSIWNDRNQ